MTWRARCLEVLRTTVLCALASWGAPLPHHVVHGDAMHACHACACSGVGCCGFNLQLQHCSKTAPRRATRDRHLAFHLCRLMFDSQGLPGGFVQRHAARSTHASGCGGGWFPGGVLPAAAGGIPCVPRPRPPRPLLPAPARDDFQHEHRPRSTHALHHGRTLQFQHRPRRLPVGPSHAHLWNPHHTHTCTPHLPASVLWVALLAPPT